MTTSSIMECIFCQIATKKAPAHIVYEDDKTLAFLDKYPQTKGHIQLIPKQHYRWVYEIPFVAEFFSTAAAITRGIIPVLGADHVSWGTFGQQIYHAHLWIVPQYRKETQIQEFAGKKAHGQEGLAHQLQVALNQK